MKIQSKSLTFSFTTMRLNVSSAKWRPFCLGLNVSKGMRPIRRLWVGWGGWCKHKVLIPRHWLLIVRVWDFSHDNHMTFSISAQDCHYCDVTMGAVASQITSLTIVYSTVCSDADKKHQISVSLAFVREIHRNYPQKGPVTRKMFPFDDVII